MTAGKSCPKVWGDTSWKDPLNLAMLTEGSNIQVGWTITTRNLYLVFGPLWGHRYVLILGGSYYIYNNHNYTPKPTFRFQENCSKTTQTTILFFGQPVFFFFPGGVGGGWTFIRQDVLGSIFADSMLSMSSEPSQPGAHDTADHFTGWVGRIPKGEDGEGFREGSQGSTKKERARLKGQEVFACFFFAFLFLH